MKKSKQHYKPDPSKRQDQAELYRQWRADHNDELAEYNQEQALASLGKNASYAATYRARKLNALPAWADLDAIEKLYKEAVAKGMHVDHIYPLRGAKVCGLHVLANLCILTKSENLRKGNKFPRTESVEREKH